MERLAFLYLTLDPTTYSMKVIVSQPCINRVLNRNEYSFAGLCVFKIQQVVRSERRTDYHPPIFFIRLAIKNNHLWFVFIDQLAQALYAEG